MHHIRLLAASALLAAATLFLSPETAAQQHGQDWFVPNQQRTAPRSGPVRSPAARPAPVQTPSPVAIPAPPAEPEAPPPQIQVQLPPAPALPPIPKGATPPAAVIGVLGLSDISRGSAAAQEVDKELSGRMTKLHDDAQKEQAAWRDVQQKLASQRGSLNAEQIRARERELQERVTKAQREFRDRNRVIQEAAQYARAQIERMLQKIVVQVADSRGINLVLHREEVVLNTSSFDITEDVVKQLNAVLPTVVIPPEGVSVSDMPGAVPTAQAKPGAPTTESSASPPPAKSPGPAAASDTPASAPPAASAPTANTPAAPKQP